MSRAENQQQGIEEDKKPGSEGDHIIVKVKGLDGKEVSFKMRRTTQLKKLMYVYSDHQSLELEAICFFFDGRRLRKEQTPDELEMKDGDEIDVLSTIGGPCLLCTAAAMAQPGYSSSTPSVSR